jgi:DNA-binding IscR family transcriptional regulator
MRNDSRLCVALHVLLHMSETDRPVTSEMLGSMLDQNPAALRRTMAGLRDAGIVRAEKGHGGGWALARSLDGVTLADVYDALRMPAPFRIGHREPSPRCRLERAVNRAVDGALAQAEALLVDRLRTITLADTLTDARRKPAGRQ